MALNDKFRSEFKKVVAKAKDKNELFCKGILVQLDNRLLTKSPVDKGTFKGNWRVGNGVINTLTTESTAVPNNEPEINSIKINGQVIYLTNSLDYASVIEYGRYGRGKGATVLTTRDGYSIKAPYGVVRITLVEFQGAANQVGAALRMV